MAIGNADGIPLGFRGCLFHGKQSVNSGPHDRPLRLLPSAASLSMPIPTDLASFLDIARQHGGTVYSIIFAYAASHSLLTTLFAGYAAHAGALAFWPLVLTCWIGSFLGDVVRFWIGRRYGTELERRFPKLGPLLGSVARLADKHYVWMILAHRYPHGIRGVAGFVYGRSTLSWGTFLALNLVASGAWAAIVASIGYGFGQVSEKALNDASASVGLSMLLGFLGLSWYLSRRLERMIADRPSA